MTSASSSSPRPLPIVERTQQKKGNRGIRRPKHEVKTNIANDVPVSGPFSLGPSAISRVSLKSHTDVASNHGFLSSTIGAPLKTEDNQLHSELTELQHLNATFKMEEGASSSFAPLPQDSLFMLQLPSLLPHVEPWFLAQKLASVKTTASSVQQSSVAEDFERRSYSALLEEPSIDGKIGKIRIHRSGRLTLCIGPMTYQVPLQFLIL